MSTPPKKIGSFLDKKFREATARLLFTAPRVYQYKDTFASTGALTNEEAFVREFQSGLFSKVGDGFHIEFVAKFAANANAKNYKVQIQDSLSASIVSFDVAPVAVNGTKMSSVVNFTYTNEVANLPTIKAIGHTITSETSYYQVQNINPIPVHGKWRLVVLTTGGAANDLVFQDFRVIFMPGITA